MSLQDYYVKDSHDHEGKNMQINSGGGSGLWIPVSPRFCNWGLKESVCASGKGRISGISQSITHLRHGLPYLMSSHQLPVRNH